MKTIPLSSIKRDNSNITYYSRELWKALRKERFKPLTKEKYDRYVAYRQATDTLSVDPYGDLELQMDLDAFKSELDSLELECFNLFLEGLTQAEISTLVSMHCRQQRVSEILQNLQTRFKDFYEEHLYV